MNSGTYFIVKNPENDEELTKKFFLKNILKIGMSIDLKFRNQTYNVLDKSHKLYQTNAGLSKKSISFGETITTMNINLYNLDGSKCRPHFIYIDTNILNFEQQNLLAMNFFDDVYDQYITHNTELRKK